MRQRRSIFLASVGGVLAACATATALAAASAPPVQTCYAWVQPSETHTALAPTAGDPTAQPSACVDTAPAAFVPTTPPGADYPWVQPPAPGFSIASPPQDALQWVQPPAPPIVGPAVAV